MGEGVYCEFVTDKFINYVQEWDDSQCVNDGEQKEANFADAFVKLEVNSAKNG